MARRALSWCVVLVLLAAGPGAASSFIPTDGRSDALASVPRTWSVSGLGGAIVDLEGAPVDPQAPHVAFRFDSEVAFIEGALAAAAEEGRLDPWWNAGARFHAVTLDPPLPVGPDSALRRVFPGPLELSTPVRNEDTPGGVSLGAAAVVPLPRAGDTSPEAGADLHNESGVAVALWFETVAAATQEDAVGSRSPALARWTLLLQIDPASFSPPPGFAAWQGHANVTFTVHLDFGNVARGATFGGNDTLRADGVYLERGDGFATLRTLHDAVVFRGAGADGAMPRTVVAYEAPPGRRVPGPDEAPLSTPVTLNVTVPRPFGPVEEGTEAQVLVVGVVLEFGFLAARWDRPVPDAPDETPEADATPGPGVGPLVLTLVAALGLTRWGRFLPTTSRTPRS